MLDRAKRWFALISEQAIQRSSFISVHPLRQKIELLVKRYSADTILFRWAVTADSVLQKIEKVAKRIFTAGQLL